MNEPFFFQDLSGDPNFDGRYFNAETSTEIAEQCDWIKEVPDCNSTERLTIRSFDGSCNNLQNPNSGRAFTPFRRLIDPQYARATVNGPRISQNGTDLPSARLVSTTGKSTISREFANNQSYFLVFFE